MEKLRIYWVSPFAPVKSGLAAYSEAITEYMSKNRIAKIIRVKPSAARFAAERCSVEENSRIIYNIGNHPANMNTYAAAVEFGGTVLLHDANLHDLVYGISIAQRRPELYLKLLYNEPGINDVDIRKLIQSGGTNRELMMKYPMLSQIVHSGSRFIVHSNYAEQTLKRYSNKAVILETAHFSVWFRNNKCRKTNSFKTVGIFGYMSPEKRINEIIQAFIEYKEESGSDMHLFFAGEHAGVNPYELLRKTRVISDCSFEENLDDAEYINRMAEMDAILNLRSPTRGETSGNAVKAMSLGVPIGLNVEDAHAEIPEECFFEVKSGNLKESIKAFYFAVDNDYESMIKKAENARSFADEYYCVNSIAKNILDFISKEAFRVNDGMRKIGYGKIYSHIPKMRIIKNIRRAIS